VLPECQLVAARSVDPHATSSTMQAAADSAGFACDHQWRCCWRGLLLLLLLGGGAALPPPAPAAAAAAVRRALRLCCVLLEARDSAPAAAAAADCWLLSVCLRCLRR
jgi:hypothetical protein